MPVYVVFLAVSFLASIVGAVCGIGGGVIIKPVLDAFGVLDVSAISFLSGCTVLAMSLYSVGRNKIAGTLSVDMSTGTPLAAGAAVGGVVGKYMFQAVRQMFENQNTVGAVQAACLMILTLGTLIYTLKKSCIKTHHLKKCSGLSGDRPVFRYFIVFSRNWGRTHQSGNSVLLFFHDHESGCTEFTLYNSVLPGNKPSRICFYRNDAVGGMGDTGRYGGLRRPGRYYRALV